MTSSGGKRTKLVEVIDEDDEPVVSRTDSKTKLTPPSSSPSTSTSPAAATEEPTNIIGTANVKISLKDVLLGIKDRVITIIGNDQKQECKACQLTGEILDVCRSCRGKGVYMDALKEVAACQTCNGSKQAKLRCEKCRINIKARLTVPAGVASGTSVVIPIVSDKKDVKEHLRCVVEMAPHESLRRSDRKREDVVFAIRVPLEKVLKGKWEVTFKDVDDTDFTFEADPEHHRGEVMMVLTGKGLPTTANPAKRGDLIIAVEPLMPPPSWFSAAHMEAIEKLF